MRYNPATDNAIANEQAQADLQWCSRAAVIEPEPEPELTELDEAIVEITYSLWSTAARIRFLTGEGLNPRDLHSMARDIQEVSGAFELLKMRL